MFLWTQYTALKPNYSTCKFKKHLERTDLELLEMSRLVMGVVALAEFVVKTTFAICACPSDDVGGIMML